MGWSIFFSVAIIAYFCLSLFVITFRAFKDNEIINGYILTCLILGVCLLDSVLSMNTCFIRNGKLVTSRQINMQKYMSSWVIFSDSSVLLVLLVRLVLLRVESLHQGNLSTLNLIICLKFYNIHRYQRRLKFYYFR